MKKSELRYIIREEILKEAKVTIKPGRIFTPESLYDQLEYSSNQLHMVHFNLVESPTDNNVIIILSKNKKVLFRATVKNRSTFKKELINHIGKTGGANLGIRYVDAKNAELWFSN